MINRENLKAAIISEDGVIYGIGDDKNAAWQDMLSFIDKNDADYVEMPDDLSNAIAFLKRRGYMAEHATEALINMVDEAGGDIPDEITILKEPGSPHILCLSHELKHASEMIL